MVIAKIQNRCLLYSTRWRRTLFEAFCIWAITCGAIAGDIELDISVESVNQAIDLSATCLINLATKNGTFIYRVNTNPAVKIKPRYNILRHAGAINALAMHYRVKPDLKTLTVIQQAGRFLHTGAVGEVPGRPDILAVWSRPELNHTKKPLQAKLGGTGLGLVALVSVEKISPGFVSKDDLIRLGRFITYMQKADGDFYSKYIPSEGGRNDQWTSLYYPGEAALGLVMLYEIDPDERWLQSAMRALNYLARIRKNRNDIPADHWALIATAKLLLLNHSIVQPDHRSVLLHHAWQITEAIMAEQIVDADNEDFKGGFAQDGRVTPTATRLEGLLASRTIFSNQSPKVARLDPVIQRGIKFLLRAQIKQGEFAGAFPRAISKIAAVFRDADKFNRRATEVRIDYVQHGLCALIQYSMMED